MNKLTMFVSLFVMAAFAWGCCGGSATSDEELEKALDAAFDEALKEVEAEAEAEAGGAAAPGDPCSAYAKCCMDYVDALSKLDGYPAESVDAAKTGCQAAESYKTMPGMEETCTTMLDTMKTSMESMGAFPGWETPGSCK